MKNSFLDFLESMTIAMEADDITTQTSNEVRNVLGGAPSTQTDADVRAEEEDLEKVDNIFGTETSEKAPSQNPDPDTTEEISTEGEESDPEEGTDSDGGDEDTNVTREEDPTQEEPEADKSDNLLFAKKNTIRDNLAQLYTIISGDIEIIVNSLTNVNDEKTVDVMNTVINHLRNCKSYIYKTLTKELESLEYDELLQRYITLKRVYDICIRMMETHFGKDKK